MHLLLLICLLASAFAAPEEYRAPVYDQYNVNVLTKIPIVIDEDEFGIRKVFSDIGQNGQSLPFIGYIMQSVLVLREAGVISVYFKMHASDPTSLIQQNATINRDQYGFYTHVDVQVSGMLGLIKTAESLGKQTVKSVQMVLIGSGIGEKLKQLYGSLNEIPWVPRGRVKDIVGREIYWKKASRARGRTAKDVSGEYVLVH